MLSRLALGVSDGKAVDALAEKLRAIAAAAAVTA